ncbi:CDKN2A-interacting protein isoform X2 [Cherax quadricarinatus]|uniref:CDKN2A-interacting protein isoform X2 n=1 Tax=Cherax quadricarinatus TaxID=27406 RepID=UPI00387E7115
MSVNTNWDIESYRAPYESGEHWALKQEFMEAHKSRIPEDRLVCLAQVFVNIELLGCRYPDKTMEQVSVLAQDVGQEYKESKKKKLQKDVVKASDAAGARYKGKKNKKKMKLTHQALAEKPMTFIKSSSASEETHYEKLDARPSNVSTNKSASQFLYGVNKRLSPERQSIEKQSSESQSTVDKYKNALKQNSKKVASASISDDNVIQSGRGIGVMNGRTARGSMNTHNNSTSHQQSSETDTQTLGPSQQLNPMVTNIEVIINGQTASGSMNTDNNSALNQQRPVQPNIQFCENNDPLSGFVIVQRTYTSCDSAFSKLKDSSKFSCLPVKSFWSNKT